MITVDLLTLAKKLNNHEKDATGGTTLWPDTTHYRATVPTGKRWFLYGGVANRDVSATMVVWLKNSSNDVLLQLATYAAATGPLPYPIGATTGNIVIPIPMDTGEYVEVIFGVAQGIAAYASCIVLEVDV